jgi:hypothetical protein
VSHKSFEFLSSIHFDLRFHRMEAAIRYVHAIFTWLASVTHRVHDEVGYEFERERRVLRRVIRIVRPFQPVS